MARNPDETFSISLVDRSGELSRVTFTPSSAFLTDALDPNPAPAGAAGVFYAALAGIVDGATLRRSFTQTLRVQNLAFATAGQREERWLVVYEDNVTKALYSFELPCRKASLQPPVNQDEVDLTVTAFANFKTAAEAAILSPDGNGITVRMIKLIGRNL